MKRLDPNRYFDPDPAQRRVAAELYETVRQLPIISPHGHVDPALFAAEDTRFGDPVELLIIPDHYIFRMLYSQGVPLEALGIRRKDGRRVESEPRRIWQTFAEHFYLFRGTPSGNWISQELSEVFSVTEKLNAANAGEIYDQVQHCLGQTAYQPRALFERFNIEVLCTTDAAQDRLEHHQALRRSGWKADIRPTFRPDGVVNLLDPDWQDNLRALSDASKIAIDSYASFIQALEAQRAFFKDLGATATDQAAEEATTLTLDLAEADALFQRALRGQVTPGDARRFTAHMLMESARMSCEDGLVMQIHIGSVRNHNHALYQAFGPDMGADIPRRSEFTRNLRPLLNRFGSHPRLSIILFTLDESAYARELAPLAGHYPALKLGPPWWFNDSLNGMRRYFERVMETAGLYNTAGFNDDTRAFPSIPARHDVWRRASANWVASLVVRGMVDEEDARQMVHDLAYGLAKKAYKLDQPQGDAGEKTGFADDDQKQ